MNTNVEMRKRQIFLPHDFTEEASRPAGAEATLAAVAGLVGIAGNVAGVVALYDMPSAYRVARLDEWVAAVLAQPAASTVSAVGFTVGLLALAFWARHLGREIGTPLARAGTSLVAAVALFNALGTVAPVVLAAHVGTCGAPCDAAGRSLLGLTLTLDALFNLGLGLGLAMAAFGGSARLSRAWRGLMIGAAVASLPVAAQALWDPAATLLLLAAPLWLALMALTSWSWLSGRDRS